jgi:hypothetical protein
MKKTLAVLLFVFTGSVFASSLLVGNACSVKMTDSLNKTESILSVTTENDRDFVVIDSLSNEKIGVSIDQAGYVKASVSIPVVTVAELVENYTMKNDSQLTWEIQSECTIIEKSLIVFLVMEWFYFG